MLAIMLMSAVLGWCGPFFGLRRPILGPDPNPGPDPDPIRRIFSDPMPGRIGRGIIGVFGGVILGYVIHTQAPSEGLVTIGLAGFAGGKILFDILATGFKRAGK